ncbi:hypothetical protein T4D_5718 [Trichinella pseudospiralis]|uniref:Uncharacterized protein n=1 Tax=Trichinella pseudospiralis TaxID=6337 RepID=A0A0V1FHF8_TRIPS|nr:hypothetical protein T4D_5718 [Trichinella pseudospiralis]
MLHTQSIPVLVVSLNGFCPQLSLFSCNKAAAFVLFISRRIYFNFLTVVSATSRNRNLSFEALVFKGMLNLLKYCTNKKTTTFIIV